MFEKVNSNLNLPEVDREILNNWDERGIFEQSLKNREGCEPFVFYEGPPGMNGLPHIGHATTRIYKDSILRYYAMRGYKVRRKAGWDTHGLPVELKAEKDLGLKNKAEIEPFGVDKYIAKCKEIINTYENEWRTATRKLGFWVDFDNAYRTCDDGFVESIWWSLKQLFDKGDIYEGYKVSPYCPRCGTSLANHEVAQGYQTVKDKTLFVRFKAKDMDNTYYIAWTTTPWTLPSNTALCLNSEFTYAEIVVPSGEHYILAEALIGKLFEEYEIKNRFLGSELVGREYEPLFDLPSALLQGKKAYYLTNASYVTLTDGTGIVHIAPAFGPEDYEVGKEYDLPVVNLLDDKGCFKDDLPKYAGKRNIVANLEIIEDLKQAGKVVKEQEVMHEYPHCWRCHTPLINYARAGWFVKTSKYRDALVRNNNEVAWHPESVREGRMGNFLRNNIDWNLSRDRYWGTPLNIWRCDKCGKLHSIGSRAELNQLKGNDDFVELHKPFIDAVTFDCSCGGTFRRVPQVIDCWYDSGAMPFAQWHYPFENKEIFEEQFPADFICEAQDQTRGWFYTLQAISTMVFDKTPYKSCVMCGLISDKNGQKMSKSLGNVVNPDELIDKYGADAVRLYFCSNSAPWMGQKFDEAGLAEIQRKTLSTLWNVYSFFVLYANIDGFEPRDIDDCQLSLMDKWLLSQLNELIDNIDTLMKEFNFTDTTRNLCDFIDILSNWYVRRSRERFWVNGESADKTAAFNTLYYVLVTLTKLCAPFMPFVSDKIYLNLMQGKGKQSVHLEDYPVADKAGIDYDLNRAMQEVIDIVALGRAGRNEANIKNRQPLGKIYVYSANNIALNPELTQVIADDLNVKSVEFIDDARTFITFELKPQLKTLGPKYGKDLGKIREFLGKVDAYQLVTDMRADPEKEIVVDEGIVLTASDILVYPKSKPNCTAETAGMITVVLDIELTPALIDEGNVREFVSKVQNMRKEAGFEVEDSILLRVETEESLAKVLSQSLPLISETLLAQSVEFEGEYPICKLTDINGMECKISIKKVEL